VRMQHEWRRHGGPRRGEAAQRSVRESCAARRSCRRRNGRRGARSHGLPRVAALLALDGARSGAGATLALEQLVERRTARKCWASRYTCSRSGVAARPRSSAALRARAPRQRTQRISAASAGSTFSAPQLTTPVV
jgi:hypothetical protein